MTLRIFQPSLGKREVDAVAKVFEDQWPGAGPRVAEFERAFAASIETPHEQLIAVTSCTEGLFQSLHGLRLQPEDEVIMPTVSFIGAAHAARSTGATIRLTDVNPRSLNPQLGHIEEAITPKTKAIVLLHYGGYMAEIDKIATFARAHNVILIEDSACSLGGRFNGKPYGTFGDIGVWSFDAMKLLVTGDGGMIRVSDSRLRQRITDRVRLGGVVSGSNVAANQDGNWWETNPKTWGRRAFMNDLTASIGLVQLRRVEAFIRKRRRLFHRYDKNLAEVSSLNVRPELASGAAPYFYWIQTASAQVRDQLARHLKSAGIYTTFRYWPLHRTELYSDSRSYPGADLAADTTLLLPLHQNLSLVDVDRIAELMADFLNSPQKNLV